MNAPALHRWVCEDLARLAKAGITPTLAESVWLADLARSAHTPPGRESYVDPASPLSFCGLTYWPLTMKAMKWFQVWFEAFADQPEIQGGIYLFAHLRSKPGDMSLSEFSEMDQVARAVTDWLQNVPLRPDQFSELQRRLQAMRVDDEVPPVPDPKHTDREEPAASMTPEERAGDLCAMFKGTSPDFWLTGISDQSATMVAASMVARENGGGCWANSPTRTRRIASYMNAVKWIVHRAEKDRANGA
jgi:hypothetical protein